MKRDGSDPNRYIAESKHGGDGPSLGLKHIACEHKGQTILAPGANNNVGRVDMGIENSLLDGDGFGGGVDFTELDVQRRDARRDEAGRPNRMYAEDGRMGSLRVEDEHGDRGVKRTTATERRQDALDRTSDLARGFISTGRFYGPSS
jgi:hypothetical protein